MLDLALASWDPPLPPEIPRMVEEREWLSDLGSRAARRTAILADEYQAFADQWLAKLHRLQDAWSAAGLTPSVDRDLGELGEVIERTEKFAARRAKWRARFAKRSQTAVKRAFARDPSLAAVERTFVARLLAIDDLIIRELLEHALFLRAIRADLDPAARGGPTFSDPDELRRHVTASLAG